MPYHAIAERLKKAIALLRRQGLEVGEPVQGKIAWELPWRCRRGHSGSSTVYNVLRGSGCLKCRRIGRQPRQPTVLAPGTRNGDLEVVEYLGVVNGFSRVVARNVVSGVQRVMLTGDFKKAKRRLLGPAQLAEIHRKAAAKMLAKVAAMPRHPISRLNWSDLLAAAGVAGLRVITEQDPNSPVDYTAELSVACRCGVVFHPSQNNILTGNTRSCGCVKSHQQAELAAFIQGLGVEVVINDRSLIPPKEVDIVVSQARLAIEYHGLYWHGEGRRLSNRTATADKARQLRALGWRLIVVFEDEWLTRRSAVETRIRAVLGRLDRRIGARSCDVVELASGDARDFMETTHLQGWAPGRTVALSHAGEVVAAATFAEVNASRGRRSGEHLELVRFAVKAGTGVPGGFQRLLAAGRRGRSVLTYADSRWSEGAVYRKAGFRLHGVSPPSYWYFRKDEAPRRTHRYTLRKSVLLKRYGGDPVKTEWELAQAAGWDRVWDLGCTRWILLAGE